MRPRAADRPAPARKPPATCPRRASRSRVCSRTQAPRLPRDLKAVPHQRRDPLADLRARRRARWSASGATSAAHVDLRADLACASTPGRRGLHTWTSRADTGECSQVASPACPDGERSSPACPSLAPVQTVCGRHVCSKIASDFCVSRHSRERDATKQARRDRVRATQPQERREGARAGERVRDVRRRRSGLSLSLWSRSRTQRALLWSRSARQAHKRTPRALLSHAERESTHARKKRHKS